MSSELFEHYLRDDESRRGPAAERRLHRRRRRRRLRRPLADLARRSRTGASPRSASTPRAAARPGPRPPRSPRWSTASRSSTAARIGIDEVDAAIGGLTPAKRHAAQLAADALHRALASAAASPSELRLARRPGEPRRGRHVRRRRQRRRGAARARARGRGGRRSRSSSGPTRRPTAPRPAARPRRCSAPAALAHSLGIPHFTLDLEEDFRRRVVGRFISGYAAGATPNPCIALQRRGADRGDGRPRRAARRRRA